MVAEKDHSPKILGSIIRSKGSKVGGDGAILLCTGQSIARHMVFSSWYQLTANGVLKITDDVYGEPNAYKTLFCKCPVDLVFQLHMIWMPIHRLKCRGTER